MLIASVSGYTRADGTHVSAYSRSAPGERQMNQTLMDNWARSVSTQQARYSSERNTALFWSIGILGFGRFTASRVRGDRNAPAIPAPPVFKAQGCPPVVAPPIARAVEVNKPIFPTKPNVYSDDSFHELARARAEHGYFKDRMYFVDSGARVFRSNV